MEKKQALVDEVATEFHLKNAVSTSNKTPKSHLMLILLYRLTHHALEYLQYGWHPFFFCNNPKH